MVNRRGKWKRWLILHSWAPKSLRMVTAAMKFKDLLLGRKAMTNLDSRDITLCSQSYGFSSSHVQMWKLDHKEGWAPKNWCFWIVVLESSLDCKNIKPVNPKESQPWIFVGRTDTKAEAYVKVKSLSRVRLLATPWTAAYQAPPSMGFSRQEHWSGLPFPSPVHESEKWTGIHSVMSDS